MPKRVHFLLSKKGLITISAEMPTRQLAADVANAYVEALDQVNQEKAVSRARNSRIYIESQLAQTLDKLTQATRRLANFQQQNQAVSLEDQTKSAIERAGELKGQIIAKEVQLGVLRQSMKSANPVVEKLCSGSWPSCSGCIMMCSLAMVQRKKITRCPLRRCRSWASTWPDWCAR